MKKESNTTDYEFISQPYTKLFNLIYEKCFDINSTLSYSDKEGFDDAMDNIGEEQFDRFDVECARGNGHVQFLSPNSEEIITFLKSKGVIVDSIIINNLPASEKFDVLLKTLKTL